MLIFQFCQNNLTPQEYEFSLQAPTHDDGQQRNVTLGKCMVDMTQYLGNSTRQHYVALSLPLTDGPPATLSITITASPVKGLQSGDEMTSMASDSVSEMSASVTGGNMRKEQDLQGFDDAATHAATRTSYGSQRSSMDLNRHRNMAPSPAAAPRHVERKQLVDPSSNLQSKDKSMSSSPGPSQRSGAEEDIKEGFKDDFQSYYAEADNAVLQTRLTELEAEVVEAEAVAEEAVSMLEDERSERQAAQAMCAQLQRDLDWAQKKSAKELAEYESRMKDSFKKMEEAVLLAERVQKEKAELNAQITKLREERAHLEELVDQEAMMELVEQRVEESRLAIKEEAQAEIRSIKIRLDEAQRFADDAEARALRAESQLNQASGAQVALVGAAAAYSAVDAESCSTVNPDVGNHFEYSKTARELMVYKEQAEAMSLEVEYLKAELQSLRNKESLELRAAREEAEAESQRSARVVQELEAVRGEAHTAQLSLAQAESRILELEGTVEQCKLQLTELQHVQATSLKERSPNSNPNSNSGGSDSVNRAEVAAALLLAREAQNLAENRGGQIATLNKELMNAKDIIAALQSQVSVAVAEGEDAKRNCSLRTEELALLQERLQTVEGQLEETKRVLESNSNRISMILNVPDSMGEECSDQEELEEARMLAESAATQAAQLVQELAHAQAERLEANAKVDELREELMQFRNVSDTQELLAKVHALERDLQVARNRAEVNILFRDEHERLAGELISTKLSWAQGQEELTVLRRELMKAEEKVMELASKLTTMETKLYRRVANGAASQQATNGASATRTSTLMSMLNLQQRQTTP